MKVRYLKHDDTMQVDGKAGDLIIQLDASEEQIALDTLHYFKHCVPHEDKHRFDSIMRLLSQEGTVQ